MIVFTIVYVIGIVVLEKLFEYIFDDLLKSLLWWSSIVFLNYRNDFILYIY